MKKYKELLFKEWRIDPLRTQRNQEFRPALMYAGTLYSFIVVIFLIIGSRLQRNEFYSGILATEFVLLALPAVIMPLLLGYDTKKLLRLNKIGATNIMLIFFIMVFSVPAVAIINFANLWIMKMIFGQVTVPQLPAINNIRDLILTILVVAVSAGICEEVLFRGTIQRSLERLGKSSSIFLTALLFGLMHVDFQKLLGTFLLGALIGYMVYRTNSIYGGILAHFLNNAFAVLISFASTYAIGAAGTAGGPGTAGINTVEPAADINALLSSYLNLSGIQLVGVIFVWGLFLFFCASVLFGLIRAFSKTTTNTVDRIPAPDRSAGFRKNGLLWFIPGILFVCLVYMAEAFKLSGSGVHFNFMNWILGLPMAN
jgi:uncharacterized protein